MAESIYEIEVEDIEGRRRAMEDYRGKVLLVVNTASHCGFTPQLQGLESLHESLGEEGLVVLGFPCNQFGSQEPGSEDEIREFCEVQYGVGFPLHKKVEVNGDGTHPLFAYLKSEAPGVLGSRNIKWNFTKFLIGRDGTVIGRFGSTTKPSKLEGPIRKALSKTT